MRKLLNLLPWRRGRLERSLDRELRYHLDRRIDDLRNAGLRDSDARRQAQLELGGFMQVQEEVRDVWVWRWLDERRQDLRYALRTLRRTPGFTITVVFSLALGIGANAAIFSLFDQVLFRLLPVNEPERLVMIDWRGNQLADGWGDGRLMSYPICRDLQAQDAFFDGVFCRHPTTVTLSTGAMPEPVLAEIVSGSYFPVLGVRPALGRLIVESDDLQQNAHPVVVLSHDYWQRALGGAADVVGRTVRLNNHPMTVIGVAPAEFRGVDLGDVPALWVPAMMKRQVTPEWDRLLDRRARWMQVFGRLKPGLTAARAQTGLQPWFKAMLQDDTKREDFPRATAEERSQFLASTIEVLPAAQGWSPLRTRLDTPLRVLMAGTLLLLLLASLNVASLFVARGAARAREIRTRMAIGASRGRVAGLLLADSVIIALAGGLLGLLIAPLVSQTLLSFLPADIGSVDLSPHMDRRVFAFTFAVSLVTGLGCGLAPAWQAGRLSLIASLKTRPGNAGGGLRLRKSLVVGQIAFTLILLVAAGLFVQTLARLETQGPGFSTDRLLTFRVNPFRGGHTRESADRVMRELYDALRALPDAEGAAVARINLLTGGSWNARLTLARESPIVTDRVHLNPVSASFFTTLGTRVIAGRDFDTRDERRTDDDDFKVMIVNESFARRYFNDASPIGRRVGLGGSPGTPTEIEIIGVVKDFSYRGLREQTEQAFLPYFQLPAEGGTFYVRMRGEPQASFAALRAAVAQVDASLPLIGLRTLDEQVDRALTTERMLATLSGGFGALALLLSTVGLAGVMSFIVTSRTPEIGIRLALGATPSATMRLVLKEAMTMLAIGGAVALPCIFWLGRLVESQLFGVHAIDAPTIVAGGSLLALTVLGAAFLPARRAASVRPTEALRTE